MPRNSSGTMSLPSPGVPFQSGQTISSAQVNATLSDLATEISDSASRSGKGGFTAPVRVPDGNAAAPAVAFGAEINSGAYRAGTNDVRLAVGGVDALKLTGGGVADGVTLVSGQTAIRVTLAGGNALIQGNLGATQAGAPADVVTNTTATRTAGNIFKVQNNSADKLFVDYQGLLSLATPAAAIQPASIWTALTLNANWTAGGGLAYWKDATGTVHIKGTAISAAGAAGLIFTLPAGYRPVASRIFVVQDNGSGATVTFVTVDAGGGVSITGTFVPGHFYPLDPISFLAEQ